METEGRGPAHGPEGAQPEADQPETAQPEAARPAGDQREATGEPLRADALVLTCISLLASKAWQAMGLIPDPATNRIERRLEDAQLSIDAAAALMDLVRGRIGDADRRELETLLMNLRVNFVEQRAKG